MEVFVFLYLNDSSSNRFDFFCTWIVVRVKSVYLQIKFLQYCPVMFITDKFSLNDPFHKKLYMISFRIYKNDFTTFFIFAQIFSKLVDPHHRWPHGHANFYFCNRKSSLTQKSLRNYFSLSRKSILRKQQKVAVNNLMTLLGWKWNI